jgi:hypothetical protein
MKSLAMVLSQPSSHFLPLGPKFLLQLPDNKHPYKTKFRCLSPRANYIDQATAACRRS